METFLAPYKERDNFFYFTQKDDGWRKTLGVNRAVTFAHADYLMFLDGHCISDPDFVSLHLENAEQGEFLTGRRVYLEPMFSKYLRKHPNFIKII